LLANIESNIILPKWYCGDSCNIDSIINDRDFDFILTCPPYHDLEKYSDDPADISNMSYADFLKAYRTILHKSVSMLKPHAFIAIVVGEIRDKYGAYCGFVPDTINIMNESGCIYYNDICLITQVGTAAVRAPRIFGSNRKVVKTHQDVIVFLRSKGSKAELKKFMGKLSSVPDEIF